MILCLCPNPSIDKFVWIEKLVNGKVNRIEKEQSFPGGKGIHVASGIAELREECAVLGFWGGYTGKWIKQFCEKKGIRCFGPEVNELNRTCLTFRSNNDLNGTELLGTGPFINEENRNLFWLEYIRLLEQATIVCMSGSWPPANNNLDYIDYIKEAEKKGIKSFIDCSGDSLVKNLSAIPFGIHINQQEGMEVFKEQSPLKIGEKILSHCDIAAITCGADGLYLFQKNQAAIHASCKLDNVLSAVGCGDALMAGLVVAQKRNLNFIETASLSVACASANCMREELGMFYKRDADNLLTKIEVSFVQYELTL